MRPLPLLALFLGCAWESPATAPVVAQAPLGDAQLRITSPASGAAVSLEGWERVVEVEFHVEGAVLRAPGSCLPSDGPCGHVVVTVDGALCNVPGLDWNVATWTSPARPRLASCAAAEGPHTVALALVHDDRTPALGPSGAPVSAELTINASIPSLYVRLGGQDGIHAGFETLLTSTLLTNGNLGAWFLNGSLDRERLVHCLSTQLSAAAGGPEVYECRSMAEAHAGLGVSSADWDTFQAAFVEAFSAQGFAAADVGEAWELLQTHRGEIVEDEANWATLYQRAGRWSALRATTSDLGNRIVADPSLAPFFVSPGLPDAPPIYTTRAGFCIARLLCAVGDGPCLYGDEVLHPAVATGPCRDLVEQHAGMVDAFGNPIGIDHFLTLATHLSAALDTAGVPAYTRDAFLTIVASTCAAVVADPAACEI